MATDLTVRKSQMIPLNWPDRSPDQVCFTQLQPPELPRWHMNRLFRSVGEQDCSDPQSGTDTCKLLRTRARAVTVLCDCLISFLYSTFLSVASARSSCILVLSSCYFSHIIIECLIMSLIVGASCALSALPVLEAGLLQHGDDSRFDLFGFHFLCTSCEPSGCCRRR